jgi:hypothetical protein
MVLLLHTLRITTGSPLCESRLFELLARNITTLTDRNVAGRFAFGGYYFGFVGANIAGITYLLDAYPARSGPVLVVITALRGFVSFGTSYGVATFIETAGYDGSFGVYAGITAFLGLLGLPIYFYGKQLREFTGKWAVKERTGKPSMAR